VPSSNHISPNDPYHVLSAQVQTEQFGHKPQPQPRVRNPSWLDVNGPCCVLPPQVNHAQITNISQPQPRVRNPNWLDVNGPCCVIPPQVTHEQIKHSSQPQPRVSNPNFSGPTGPAVLPGSYGQKAESEDRVSAPRYDLDDSLASATPNELPLHGQQEDSLKLPTPTPSVIQHRMPWTQENDIRVKEALPSINLPRVGNLKLTLCRQEEKSLLNHVLLVCCLD